MNMFRLRLTGLLVVSILAAGAFDSVAAKQKYGTTAQSVRFGVLSDTHLYNVKLGTTGSAFEQYLLTDPKLLAQSEAILESTMDSLIASKVQFVLICGDLTKDGELVDHVLMAQHLAKLRQHGIQVFVIPGNHDINNPDAFTYLGDTTRPVPNTSPETFVALYHRFGYGQSIARDTASLSYVAEPVPGLRLIAIDSCKYQQNLELGTPVVSGRISPETMTWILAQIQEAKSAGKQVIAFMHHGLNAHFLPEPILFPDYLVDDWPIVGGELAAAGLRVIFTGHYHQQDAAWPLDANGLPQETLCDVQTSSLGMFPCAFRIVTIEGGTLNIHSERVTQIDADTGGLPFQVFAEQTLRSLLPAQVYYELETLFGLSQEEAALVAPLVIDALVANYAGDENPAPETMATIQALLAQPEPYHTLGQMLAGFWIDLPPADNDLVLPFTFSNSSLIPLAAPVAQ